MEPALLTIGIPTRNRAGYLRDLLAALEFQSRDPIVAECGLEILVSDNASTDDTGTLARSTADRLPILRYWRNDENIGARGNYHKLVHQATGRFVWIIGDDDLLLPGGLAHGLRSLRDDPDLALLILFDTRYNPRIQRPARFASYRNYIRECARVHPHALVEHTLTTSNIYRADAFDRVFAKEKEATDFLHMYGMARGLKNRGGAVQVSAFPTIQVRDSRAPAVDAVWPTDLERSWLEYLGWLRDQFDVPELRPELAIDHIRRELIRKITRHPIRYVCDNLHALKQPQAWWWFLKRLFFHGRHRRP